MSDTILLIEDQAQVRQLLAEILSAYQIVEAATSQEAIAQMATVPPDLIILDLILEDSDMQGLEFCVHIKKLPDFEHIPVLILSGAGTVSDVSAAMAVGAADFISKPYSPIRLLDTIARLLRNA